MSEEQPKNPKNAGRHKNPEWEFMTPRERLYVKCDLITRKYTKRVPPGIVDIMRIEAATLGLISPDGRLVSNEDSPKESEVPKDGEVPKEEEVSKERKFRLTGV